MKKTMLASLVLAALVPQSAYSADSCKALFETKPSELHSTLYKRLDTDLYFRAYDPASKTDEHSIREGTAAAHIYTGLDKTNNPYFFFGFPAGNSGVAMWFKSAGSSFIEAMSPPRALQNVNGLNGAEIDLKTGTKQLSIDDEILGSLRFVRDRELGRNIFVQSAGKMLRRLQNHRVSLQNGKLIYERIGFNGISKYRMEIEPLADTKIIGDGSTFHLVSSGEVKFRARGFTSEKPLTPMSLAASFKPEALAAMQKDSPERLEQLSFLWYKEKLMAGSPRYFSKFGRDSIYTLNALMDSLQPSAIEDLLTATMSSIDSKTGQVSHEQHEGDFVGFELTKEGKDARGRFDVLEDTKMHDDDMAFSDVLGKFQQQYPERFQEFMNRKDARGIEQRVLVKKLHAYIEEKTTPFVTAVEAFHAETNPAKKEQLRKDLHKYLVTLDEPTGQWRDSNLGLGGGLIPFDVSAVFVPAALKGMYNILSTPDTASHPNDLYDAARAAKIKKSFDIWRTEVTPLFEVRVKKEDLRARAEAYFKTIGRDLSELPPTPTEDIVFSALSLDKDGTPIPVMHSDDSLMMAFGYPTESYLKSVSQRLRLPFPYGLRTPLGFVIANPVFASTVAQKEMFGTENYHGTVIWTMQEDFMVIGMGRQIFRKDLSHGLKQDLIQDVHLVEKVLHDRGNLGGIEVFTPTRENGKWVAKPFNGDAKGNSNQLWGHLRLVIPDLLKRMKAASTSHSNAA